MSIALDLKKCKFIASLPEADFDILWDDGCCDFVSPPGKCGRSAGAKACNVNVSIGNINLSPSVGENGKMDIGEIPIGIFGSTQQCGS